MIGINCAINLFILLVHIRARKNRCHFMCWMDYQVPINAASVFNFAGENGTGAHGWFRLMYISIGLVSRLFHCSLTALQLLPAPSSSYDLSWTFWVISSRMPTMPSKWKRPRKWKKLNRTHVRSAKRHQAGHHSRNWMGSAWSVLLTRWWSLVPSCLRFHRLRWTKRARSYGLKLLHAGKKNGERRPVPDWMTFSVSNCLAVRKHPTRFQAISKSTGARWMLTHCTASSLSSLGTSLTNSVSDCTWSINSSFQSYQCFQRKEIANPIYKCTIHINNCYKYLEYVFF